MQYDHIDVPEHGEAITANRDHTLNVPEFPIIPFVEGDGIGVDVTPVMLDVVNAAVSLAYGDQRRIHWMQVYAGQAAADLYGDDEYLPDETLHAQGLAPDDDTYKVSGTKKMKEVKGSYRFVRGHMCPKDTADRISSDAGYNTHTVCSTPARNSNGRTTESGKNSSSPARIGPMNTGASG